MYICHAECKVMKYRRFWIDRKKAVNFYGQLGLTFLQVQYIDTCEIADVHIYSET